MSIILSVTLSVLSEGHNLDLDIIAFLLVSLISQEEGVEVTEEQRTWWRVAEIMEIMVSSPASPLAATFQAGRESEEVKARAGLYYRASLDTIALLERGEMVRSVSDELINVHLIS